MSVEHLRWAFDQSVSSSSAKLILCALAWKANKDGLAWPSQSTLAAMAGTTPAQVRRHLQALEKKGFLTSSQRPRREDGKYAGSTYRLEFSPSNPPSSAQKSQRAEERDGPARVDAQNQRAFMRDIEIDKRDRQIRGARANDEPHPRFAPWAVDNGPQPTDEQRAEYQARVRDLAQRFRDGKLQGDDTS